MKITKSFLKQVIKEELERLNENYNWQDEIDDVFDNIKNANPIHKQTKATNQEAKNEINSFIAQYEKDNNYYTAAREILGRIEWYQKNRPESGVAEAYANFIPELNKVLSTQIGTGRYNSVPQELRGGKYQNTPAPKNVRPGKF